MPQIKVAMSTIRLNISLPDTIVQELNKEVEARQRSRFIAEAVKEMLQKKRDTRLAMEYQEAADEVRRINQDLEGALSDGLD